MKLSKVLLTLLIACFLSLPAQARELKVGIIDIQKGLNETAVGKRELAKLQKLQDSSAGELKGRQEKLINLEKELTKQGFMLSEDARREKEEKFRRLKRDFERYREDKMNEFVRLRNMSTAKIYKGLVVVLKEFAKTENFDLIFEAGKNSRPAPGAILYYGEKIDITSKVIALYNQKNK